MDSVCLLVVLLFCVPACSPHTCSGKGNRTAYYQQPYCAAAAHTCAHESDFYEENTACTLFVCQAKKCGHFQSCTGRVSEDPSFKRWWLGPLSVMQIVCIHVYIDASSCCIVSSAWHTLWNFPTTLKSWAFCLSTPTTHLWYIAHRPYFSAPRAYARKA